MLWQEMKFYKKFDDCGDGCRFIFWSMVAVIRSTVLIEGLEIIWRCVFRIVIQVLVRNVVLRFIWRLT